MPDVFYKAAAHWWANKLENVSLESFDNGDKSETAATIMVLGAMLAQSCEVPKEAFSKFEERLAEEIEEKAEERDGYMDLSVGYHPDDILANVAEECGIPEELFPWKVRMRIEGSTIWVSDGYGAPYKVIYSE